jgi:hypothetical protein
VAGRVRKEQSWSLQVSRVPPFRPPRTEGTREYVARRDGWRGAPRSAALGPRWSSRTSVRSSGARLPPARIARGLRPCQLRRSLNSDAAVTSPALIACTRRAWSCSVWIRGRRGPSATTVDLVLPSVGKPSRLPVTLPVGLGRPPTKWSDGRTAAEPDSELVQTYSRWVSLAGPPGSTRRTRTRGGGGVVRTDP